jgi:altronate hydrolase
MSRAINETVFSDIVTLVNDFKQYFIDNKQPVYENPSPGNKAGGLTTLEEKSLGAIQKGGSAKVTQVIPYGALVQQQGLTLLQGPGNDAVSSTALAASGATMLLFTTGRGTPLGFPVPTVKISSNSDLAKRKPQWIDFDATRPECSGFFLPVFPLPDRYRLRQADPKRIIRQQRNSHLEKWRDPVRNLYGQL